ncbi:unnamed protein product [marine sediment metagenome]|uniref:Uncharacterized protein n=1 Tax=marine sediment metagenome TaxID=412755 RepID=X1HN67_9ZZZZ
MFYIIYSRIINRFEINLENDDIILEIINYAFYIIYSRIINRFEINLEKWKIYYYITK